MSDLIANSNRNRRGSNIQSNAHGTLAQRARGRPKGSSNKPKGLLQKHVAEEMLGILRPMLPEAEYAEIRDAIKKGKTISTLKEVKILMALMAPPIWQRLLEESKAGESQGSDEFDELSRPESKSKVEFYRDTNERIKAFLQAAQLAAKLEGDIDEGNDTTKEPLFEQFKNRGLLAERFTITGSIGPSSMGRDSDRPRGSAAGIRTVSNQLPERQIEPEDSQEVEAVGLLDSDRHRNDSLSDSEEELQRGHSIDGGEGSIGEGYPWEYPVGIDS